MSFGVIPLTFRPEFLDLFFSLSAFSLSFFYFRKIRWDGCGSAQSASQASSPDSSLISPVFGDGPLLRKSCSSQFLR
jgi:hypothetical protein